MAKKIILALITIIIIVFCLFLFINTASDSVNVYIDGENVSVETRSANPNTYQLNNEICDLTLDVMNDTTSNITTLKNKISTICNSYGLDNPEINIDSSIGKNQIPIIVHVDGTSMLPTLQDGQTVIVNKTHDVHVGDIVVAESDEYGGIIKRVGDIKGDSVYLESDNKNVDYEYENGVLYEVSGITTWVNINDINGVVISY